ncbi:Multiple antibiotic resistance protein MarR [Maioricimonas rarisocia]|uniref:Multiple antibiotic resistance protein MarR n=1 Tax=Maioricimonas rarisocia TaxID=2528026 RepID=A0A517ZCW8_9PLAN|nr:MarR family transcriptional regulator [Maioricimonas rarisocia]QDU40301.1 Multiple antibiotic resistance protein MarR [Maioricimonas rarisocia]
MSANSLQVEVKKKNPYDSPEREAVVSVLLTADRLQNCFSRLFREFGLTCSQYNVLRILRGEGAPLPSLEIASRLIQQVPAITGLIDRLESAGLVCRERCSEDRRVVFVDITSDGLALLSRIDEPLLQLHRDVTKHLSLNELSRLTRLLEKVRAGLPATSPTGG